MFTSSTTTLTLLLLSSIDQAYCWGDLGHQTIGYIASNFLKNSTALWTQRILNDTRPCYLASVATWADTYKYTSEGYFSQPFHYIDAEDNPPAACDVDFERDCGDAGCSVSAIANYTQRVQGAGNLSATEVNYALRFLVHFLGDITQPLHDEAFEVGGNDVNVTFDGSDTNLHSIWDNEMPEQLRGVSDSNLTLSDAEAWATNLSAEIRAGAFANQSSSWLTGLDVDDPKSSAMVWAKDANKYVCSVVMPNNVTALGSGDLYPEYYHSATGTVELQIAKAGYRLAAWLDAIADKQVVTRSERLFVLRHPRRIESGVDLSGRDLLPGKRELKSPAKLRRAAVGFGCGHAHKH